VFVFEDKDKSFNLGAHQMMVAAGEPGDVKQFGEYVEKNIHLYKYRHGYEMPAQQAAHFARKEIADELRKVRASGF
jgi:20S proteasome subunit beta 4